MRGRDYFAGKFAMPVGKKVFPRGKYGVPMGGEVSAVNRKDFFARKYLKFARRRGAFARKDSEFARKYLKVSDGVAGAIEDEIEMINRVFARIGVFILLIAGFALAKSLVNKPAPLVLPAKVAVPAANAETAAPKPAGDSPTDKEIAKWQAKVQANAQDKQAMTNLGDALMQKGRETADASYYGLAENSYKQALAVDAKYVDALDGMAWVTSGRHEFEQSMDWSQKALA